MKLSKRRIEISVFERARAFLDKLKTEDDPDVFTLKELAKEIKSKAAYMEKRAPEELGDYRLLHGRVYLYSSKRNVRNVLKSHA